MNARAWWVLLVVAACNSSDQRRATTLDTLHLSIAGDDGRPVSRAKAEECRLKRAYAPVSADSWIGTDDHTVRCRMKRTGAMVYHAIKPPEHVFKTVKIRYGRGGIVMGSGSLPAPRCPRSYLTEDGGVFAYLGDEAPAACCTGVRDMATCPETRTMEFVSEDLGLNYAD